ncbi:HAD-IA family hydrolase [Shewanella sp. Isolate11]|uniref:HAD-IA family hydrolase n=1 Tax=Shewanella sp. Isolate11 TaxID=2908530 RepID=UPI001EFCF562|nr:HAD-IA family hydrolase [Shewanella sp. Isolate11]MCG9695434.1 HAD-IA family hydrolase [Shewanella sp. Isolate11]
MVRIAIKPKPITVISFDLDDTLYDNRGNIINAERQLQLWLAKQFPKSAMWQTQDWLALKQQLIKHTPSLGHDTSAARKATLIQGLSQLGYSTDEATSGAEQGLQHFLHYRSDFSVPPQVLATLKQLSQHFRLIGITNGNVDAARIGLGDALEFVLHPGNGLRMKPYADLFEQAISRLQISREQLLHVGDSYRADVQGARRAGCQAAWLNPAVARAPEAHGAGLLPHIQLTSIDELLHLAWMSV